MIAFDLECSNGHTFEGWFNNLESFEEQNAKKMINCPYCNGFQIKRILSPVAVKTTSPDTGDNDACQIDYRRLAREIVDYIRQRYQDVGTKFTEEALKMHYGVTDKRNIRGSATDEEEKTLKKEGIAFFKLPLPKIVDEDTKD